MEMDAPRGRSWVVDIVVERMGWGGVCWAWEGENEGLEETGDVLVVDFS